MGFGLWGSGLGVWGSKLRRGEKDLEHLTRLATSLGVLVT